MSNAFWKLFMINVNDHKEDKQNGCSYLSWTWAWAEIKKLYPDANYVIKRFENNLPYVYDEKTGYMVFTEVTIEGLTHEMWLPVMDNMNKAMLAAPYKYKTKSGKEMWVKAADMFDINKTIMRCLVKNLAMFGLGLYIYAGEDLPDDLEDEPEDNKKKAAPKTQKGTAAAKATKKASTVTSADAAPATPTVASVMQIEMIQRLCQKVGKSEDRICDAYQVKRIQDLTPELAAEVINVLKNYEARM